MFLNKFVKCCWLKLLENVFVKNGFSSFLLGEFLENTGPSKFSVEIQSSIYTLICCNFSLHQIDCTLTVILSIIAPENILPVNKLHRYPPNEI